MATIDDLADAPELAILDALHDCIDHALALLVVQHPEITETDGLVGLPPQAWVADHLAASMRDLQRLLRRYREAAIDDARYRARLPITQMSFPHHPR